MLTRDPEGDRRPLALCCTDPAACPLQVLAWYLSRWNVEVTFVERRAWPGARAAGLVPAHHPARHALPLRPLQHRHAQRARPHPDRLPTRAAAWYAKDEPTFIDALASVRRALGPPGIAALRPTIDSPLSPRDFLASLMDAAAYAA